MLCAKAKNAGQQFARRCQSNKGKSRAGRNGPFRDHPRRRASGCPAPHPLSQAAVTTDPPIYFVFLGSHRVKSFVIPNAANRNEESLWRSLPVIPVVPLRLSAEPVPPAGPGSPT